MESDNQNHFLSNRLYDALKTVALIILPALGTFYVAIASVWGLPSANEVSATIVALVAFLGVIIKIGDASYNASEARYDGAMVIEPTATGTMHSLVLNSDPTELSDKKEVIFKVKPTGQ